MIDVTTDMLILILALSCAAEPELSSGALAVVCRAGNGAGRRPRQHFLGLALDGSGRKTLESVLLGGTLLLFGIGIVRYIRRDAARLRARRAGS